MSCTCSHGSRKSHLECKVPEEKHDCCCRHLVTVLNPEIASSPYTRIAIPPTACRARPTNSDRSLRLTHDCICYSQIRLLNYLLEPGQRWLVKPAQSADEPPNGLLMYVDDNLVSMCKSGVHHCVCLLAASVIRPSYFLVGQEVTDGFLSVLTSGTTICRTDYDHHCSCGMWGPAVCRAQNHTECTCCHLDSSVPCRMTRWSSGRGGYSILELSHHCMCRKLSALQELPEGCYCLAPSPDHHCICRALAQTGTPERLQCSRVYNLHDCICDIVRDSSVIECRARVHTEL